MARTAKISVSKNRRLVKDEDVDLVESNLNMIKEQADKVRDYIMKNDWTNLPQNMKAAEFELQSDMTNQLVSWNEAYMRGCGIIDIFERQQNKGSGLRKGYNHTGVSQMVKEVISENGED